MTLASPVTSVTPTSTAKIFDTITPSDTTEYDASLKALYISGSGDVALQDWSDTPNTVIFAVTAGQILYVRPKRVLATGTTASVVGLWT